MNKQYAAGTESVNLFEKRDHAPTGRLDSIQMLRALAVLMVALYHLTVLFPDPRAARYAIPDPLYFGYAGVDLFFVISGFIITHVTRRESIDIKEFIWKRIFRIVPLYWLITTVLVVIWFFKPGIIPIRADNAARFFLDSFFLIPTSERPLLGVGWTLQHEFQFYALIAILVYFGLKRWSAHFLFLLFAVALYLHVIAAPGSLPWDWKIFSLYALQFALGVMAYRINARWRINAPFLLIIFAAIAFICTSTLITPLMDADREVDVVAQGAFGIGRVIGYGLASFALILGALNIKKRKTDNRKGAFNRLILAVGDASFVIYLTHNLVIQALAMVTRRFDNPWFIAVGGAVALIIIVVVGIAAHVFLERPLLSFLEKRVLPVFTGHRADRLSIAATSATGKDSSDV